MASPRWALAVADDPRHPGRAGTDLLLLFAALLVAVHTRALVAAGWLTSSVGLGVGARGLAMIATRTYTADLAFLVIGAVVVYAAGGPRRAIGRAFDLACVAIVPLVAFEAIATAIVRGFDLPAPVPVGLAVTVVGYAWSGTILALALIQLRRAPREVVPPAPVRTRARGAGWGLAAVLGAGLAVNAIWIAKNLDLLKPMSDGDVAPELALPSIGAGGALGPRVTLSSLRGKIVIVEMWATWCGPCMQAMPEIGAVAARDRARGLEVLSVNLDDAAKARAIFDDGHYPMTLVAGDEETTDRYGVGPIPHAVVIDRAGVVRGVFRGDTAGALVLAESLLGR